MHHILKDGFAPPQIRPLLLFYVFVVGGACVCFMSAFQRHIQPFSNPFIIEKTQSAVEFFYSHLQLTYFPHKSGFPHAYLIIVLTFYLEFYTIACIICSHCGRVELDTGHK